MNKSKGKRNPKPLSAKLTSWWHPTLNGDLKPEDVSRWGKQVVWFLHYDMKWKQWHAWDSAPANMSQAGSCPICTGKRIVIGINDLATRNTTVADMWHPTLNGNLTPQMVTEHSGEKCWWQHKDNETRILHEWSALVSNLTSKKPTKCSVCSGHRIQVGANDLATTHPALASQWHPTLNGTLTAQMVTKGSKEEIWWQKDCFKNGIYHIWRATPNNRTGKNASGCAICSGHQVQIGVNDLTSQYPALALEWDYVRNKNLTPQTVTVGSEQKVHWKHETTDGSRHRWPARIMDRTGVNKTGCPESECAKYGFDVTLPAHLYVLSATVQETQVIQFGISNYVQTRLGKHARSGFTNVPVRLISFYKGSQARDLELHLLEIMEYYGILSCSKQNIKFDGSTEAFCLEYADEDFLEEFLELVGL